VILTMHLLHQLAVAAVLVTLTLSIQSTAMAGFVLWVRAYFAKNKSRLGLMRCADLMVRVTHVMLTLQLLEVALWAGFYRWKCFPSWDAALYFSATSYSTVGYGDLILPSNWRMLGPIEGVTGVLMSGLSVSGLFAMVTRLVRHEGRFLPGLSFESKSESSEQRAFTASREIDASARAGAQVLGAAGSPPGTPQKNAP
jgi:voltage-gated potassium channel